MMEAATYVSVSATGTANVDGLGGDSAAADVVPAVSAATTAS